jgi:DNA-binding transcriptional ArsR family regulator
MNKHSYESTAKGDAEMAEAKDALPAAQPQAVALPDDEVLYELADLFRVFGDSTRIKILYALHDNELCVQDIANAVQLSQSAVSHQLRVLKDTKLVRFRRDGKTVYYALDDDHVRSILSLGMEHIEESLKGRYYL